ncbi:MAG: DUF302 domain-containing protein [Pseudomonadota bacterium]
MAIISRAPATLALIAAAALPFVQPALAQSVVTERAGWTVIPTDKDYPTLLDDARAAIKANKMGLVTQAGPTEVAKQRGETIPGNMVLGVFRNDLAVTIIRAVPAAMIEPPVRFMVMEEPDGTASLSYIAPSAVFAPYADEGGDALAGAVATLDEIFAQIANDATN